MNVGVTLYSDDGDILADQSADLPAPDGLALRIALKVVVEHFLDEVVTNGLVAVDAASKASDDA